MLNVDLTSSPSWTSWPLVFVANKTQCNCVNSKVKSLTFASCAALRRSTPTGVWASFSTPDIRRRFRDATRASGVWWARGMSGVAVLFARVLRESRPVMARGKTTTNPNTRCRTTRVITLRKKKKEMHLGIMGSIALESGNSEARPAPGPALLHSWALDLMLQVCPAGGGAFGGGGFRWANWRV